jgi:hypothetical protein
VLEIPKALGGWGFKNIFLFSKALAAKSVWRLISTVSLWTNVVIQKYIHPDSVLDWIRNPQNNALYALLFGRPLSYLLQWSGDGLAWRVGNGLKVRIRSDPWPGSERFIFCHLN